jgi:hypothetical protein
MILTLNTSNCYSSVRYSTNSFGYSRNFRFLPSNNKFEDVIVVNNFTTALDFNIDDNELTKQAMNLSTSSFSEEWDKEDDMFWNNY